MGLTKSRDRMTAGTCPNVVDKGADPTGVANSATAFQAAATEAGTNGVIVVPSGTYRLDAVVTGTDRLWMVYNATFTGTGSLAGKVFSLTGSATSLQGPLTVAALTATSVTTPTLGATTATVTTLTASGQVTLTGAQAQINQRAQVNGLLGAGIMRTVPGAAWSGLALGGINGSGTPSGPTLMHEGLTGDEGSLAMYPGTADRPGLVSICGSGYPEDMPDEDTAAVMVQLRNGTGDGFSGEIRGGVIMKTWGEMRIATFRTTTDVSPIPQIRIVGQDRVFQAMDPVGQTMSFTNELLAGGTGGNTVVRVMNPGSVEALWLISRSDGQQRVSHVTSGVEDTVVRLLSNGISVNNGISSTDPRSSGTLSGVLASHASFAGETFGLSTTRAASSAFAQLVIRANANIQFNLRGDGEAFADGSWTGGGADYAEYFEWADGNPKAQDRVGTVVALDNGKIRPAKKGDDPIGVVSATAVVVGDAAWNYWSGQYLRDEFGRCETEEVETVAWEETVPPVMAPSTREHRRKVEKNDGTVGEVIDIEDIEIEAEPARRVLHSYVVGEIPDDVDVPPGAVRETVSRRVINPDYDPSLDYVPREDRPEWSPVGLMGKLRLRSGQPTGERWIKLRDVADGVEEWLVR